jgi:hypothetical protein
MEVWTNSGSGIIGASDARLEENFTGVGGAAPSKQTVANPVLVLTAAISWITSFIGNRCIDCPKNSKVFPHTRRKLCSKSYKVDWG